MDETTRGQIRLQVAGAKTQDFGKALARIRQHHFEHLGVREEDVLGLSARDRRRAIALRSYAGDEDLDIIRLDGHRRRDLELRTPS
jgi:transitional endoplasmic reticulum ATPase